MTLSSAVKRLSRVPRRVRTFGVVTLATTAMWTAVAPVSAAPFDSRLISEHAKFVGFIDFDAARKTELGKALLSKLVENPDYAAFEQIMVAIAGFMPATDLNDITLFGNSYKPKAQGVLVIHAKFNAGGLRGGLGLAGGFRADKRGDREVLSWDDERSGKRIYACIYDEHTILMGDAPESVGNSIDTLDDSSKSLQTVEDFPRPKGDDSWLFFAGTDVASVPEIASNPVLAPLMSITFQLGESGGKTVVSVQATTHDAQQAEQLFNLVNGVKALAGLAARPKPGADADPHAQLAGELAASFQVAREGEHVTASLAMPNDRVVAIIDEAAERKAAEEGEAPFGDEGEKPKPSAKPKPSPTAPATSPTTHP